MRPVSPSTPAAPGAQRCRHGGPRASHGKTPDGGFLRMIHSTLSTREAETCSPHASGPQSPSRSSHRSRSFKTALPIVVRRRFAPGHHEVEAAGVLRHHNIVPGVLGRFQFGNRPAADPALGLIPVEHAGPGRRLAQSVLRLQRSWPVGVVRREPRCVLQPCVRLDGACHQSRPGQRGLLLMSRDVRKL